MNKTFRMMKKCSFSKLFGIIFVSAIIGQHVSFTLSAIINDKSKSFEDSESEIANNLYNSNPCLIKYCHKGQECIVSDFNKATCICKRHCYEPKHIVCGSDGYLYPNVCELNRKGCLSSKPVSIRSADFCILKGNGWAPGFDYHDEFEDNKDTLLLNNHAKLMFEENKKKDYLVSIMFSNYDKNNNGLLEANELKDVDFAEDSAVDFVHNGCSLIYMIKYEDSDGDNKLNIKEFYSAFSKLYSVSVVSLDEALVTNHLSVKVGDNVAIKCDVNGTPTPLIIWKKNNFDLANLNDEEIQIFNDGSLYITKVQLQHAGNYTCHAQKNKEVVQTHVLTIYTVSEVKVMPAIQSKKPGEHVTMYCHVVGEPFPTIEWLKNDEIIDIYDQKKYKISKSGSSLEIFDTTFADTGAYMCRATNIGGVSKDISSLIVQETPIATTPSLERRFFTFSENGVSIYAPHSCKLLHDIKMDDIIPGTQEYLCEFVKENCNWGKAINVANIYIYVSQPYKNRVLVISKIQMVVVDIIETDEYPVDLFYVPHLDMVWVLNWRSEINTGIKTIQVIRNSSQKRKHYAIHPEPIDGQFDLVENLFLPDSNQEISTFTFKYGFVTHTNQRGFYKLDLLNMRYTGSVDLTPFNCVPTQMQFSSLYGFVIVQCIEPVTNRPTGQLVLDYFTNTIISTNPLHIGIPFISPDSRHLVTLQITNMTSKFIVQEIRSCHGLQYAFDVETSLSISDITYFPSKTTQSYDLFASSKNKEDILFLDLKTGKVEILTGVGRIETSNKIMWNNPIRPLAASGQFGKYMVTSAQNALYVLNGISQTVNCEINGILQPTAIVWITIQVD